MTKEMKVSQPKEAEIMISILKEMGVTEYEPGVINQMLEFTYKYATEVLEDSRIFANYAKKSKPIDIEDLRLAIQLQVEKNMTKPPPRDLLLELSRTRNSNPLPPIKPQNGIRLPPDRYCLSACNIQLKPGSKKGGLKTTNLRPSISMVQTKTGNSSAVTLIQKSSSAKCATPPQRSIAMSKSFSKTATAPQDIASQISSGKVVIKTEVDPDNPELQQSTNNNLKKRKRDQNDVD